MLIDYSMTTKHTIIRSRFLGIPFWGANSEQLLEEADLHGGLLTVPSAPSLAEMGRDPYLRKTYMESDWAVMDGGYVALVLRVFYGRHWPRISGLQLLEKLLGANGHPRAIPFDKRNVLWVMPSCDEEIRVRKMLTGFGLPDAHQHFYQAPVYRTREDFEDAELLAQVIRCNPDWVVLGIGGGKQEKLGYQLREALRREARPMPVILCTGGAVAFLSGGQVRIPIWADRIYIGWLLRIIDDPRTFAKRYWNAGWQFPQLLWKERGQLFSTDERPTAAESAQLTGRRPRASVPVSAKN
jgi:N-acetylglucosaminyldiphosphoundecaprenol N-acetyl-beta-D-mannosaminyltransferase